MDPSAQETTSHVTGRGVGEVAEYSAAMRHELAANAYKGDWLTDTDTGEPLDDELMLWELLYHAFKLAAAVTKGNREAILHYAADVGNHAWFIADKHGALDVALLADHETPIEYSDEAVDTPDGFASKKERAMKLARELLADVV